MYRGLLAFAAVGLVSMAPPLFADIQTTLAFTSPGTIQPGGTVAVDFGANFLPSPAQVVSTSYFDVATSSPVLNCATDLSTCEEIQNTILPSVLGSFTATLNASESITKSYTATKPGTYMVDLTYPGPGSWMITTSGSDQEIVGEQSCITIFTAGVAGAPSCTSTGQVTKAGVFDPNGSPRLTVNVATVPEPASMALVGFALGVAFIFARLNRPARA